MIPGTGSSVGINIDPTNSIKSIGEILPKSKREQCPTSS